MIRWELKIHLSGSRYHSILYRSQYGGKGIQKEIHTPVLEDEGSRKFGKSRTYFYIDEDEREFKTEEDMLKAIKEGEKC